ncbi:hypothetical protein EON77_19635 [bacterium]|nr:MAG: hypothetical protein EON77_19635 [bacterium]
MKPVPSLVGLLSLAVLSTALLAGCGGSDGGGDTNTAPAPVVPGGGTATPAISTQPSATTIVTGGSATFRVVASGTGMTYQWYRSMIGDARPIEDATAPIYATPATTGADNGAVYYVVVTNAAGSVRSADARLTVGSTLAKPRITAQPSDREVESGAGFSLSVTAIDALAYQWYKGATAITGATGATYSVASGTSADAGTYHVAVRNATGTVDSRTVRITILP